MGRKIDYTEMIGKKFGRLTVVGLNHYDKKGTEYFYDCECECGNKITVRRQNLLHNLTRSCGCLAVEWKTSERGHYKTVYKKHEGGCSFCGRDEIYAKGLCHTCYNRLKKRGTLEYYHSKAEDNARRVAENKAKRKAKLDSLKPKSELGKYFLKELKNGGSIKELAAEFGVSRQTIYNRIYDCCEELELEYTPPLKIKSNRF